MVDEKKKKNRKGGNKTEKKCKTSLNFFAERQ